MLVTLLVAIFKTDTDVIEDSFLSSIIPLQVFYGTHITSGEEIGKAGKIQLSCTPDQIHQTFTLGCEE